MCCLGGPVTSVNNGSLAQLVNTLNDAKANTRHSRAHNHSRHRIIQMECGKTKDSLQGLREVCSVSPTYMVKHSVHTPTTYVLSATS